MPIGINDLDFDEEFEDIEQHEEPEDKEWMEGT
jgi:hypothetical protein